jgi:FtsZ-binding cell division protein ZapB
MAKRKTPKTEKVVDLTPKPEKVTDEQLAKIQSAVDRINRAQMDIGQLETRKHQALHFLAGVNDELTLIQNELNDQYGTFDVNIQTGEINHPPENGETNKED